MPLRSKTALILSKHFSTKSRSHTRNQGVLETEHSSSGDTVRKNNFAPPSVPPLDFFKSFVGLVFLGIGSIFIFSTYGSVNLVFYILIIFQQTSRLERRVQDVAIDAEDLGFNSQAGQIGHSETNGSPRPATLFQSCVAQALNRGVGSCHRIPLFGTTASLVKRV